MSTTATWVAAIILMVAALWLTGCGEEPCPVGEHREKVGQTVMLIGKSVIFLPEYECQP